METVWIFLYFTDTSVYVLWIQFSKEHHYVSHYKLLPDWREQTKRVWWREKRWGRDPPKGWSMSNTYWVHENHLQNQMKNNHLEHFPHPVGPGRYQWFQWFLPQTQHPYWFPSKMQQKGHNVGIQWKCSLPFYWFKTHTHTQQKEQVLHVFFYCIPGLRLVYNFCCYVIEYLNCHYFPTSPSLPGEYIQFKVWMICSYFCSSCEVMWSR